MHPKKRNSLTLFLIYGIAVIPILLGIPPAQAEEKVTIKILKEKKEAAEPSKKPSEGKKAITEIMEEKAKAEKGKATYFYDPTNKPDPFKSFIVVRRELEEKEQGKPKTYLETLDISQVTISAIVLGSKGNWALVRDSKGDGHVIKVGTLIGRQSGKVTRILEKEVVVTESYKDIRGRKQIKDISIKLPSTDID
ncbi:MAG: pilus assembly protein PilP [Deltaproteobacteria bacterium]|nr:pilus assembly protein PilP [Deltaproteobacteria bacterium]